MSLGGSTVRHTPIQLPTQRVCPLDPAPQLAELRKERPLARLSYPDGHIGWLVTGHAVAKTIATDSRFSLRPLRRFPIGDPLNWAEVIDTLQRTGLLSQWLLALDPPEHTRYRRLLAPPFARREVEKYRTRIAEIVAKRLDAIEQITPPIDLVEAFASPVALATHCVMLGIPLADGEWLSGLRLKTVGANSNSDGVNAGFEEFRDRLRPVIEKKRVDPGDDVISYLVCQSNLSDDEVSSLAALLFTAGHGPTVGMLAVGTLALLCHPDQLAVLRGEPALLGNAVDELLRYVTIAQMGSLTRTAQVDVELDGTLIRAGDSVTISWAAANRDPEKFETPDRLDIRRRATGHMALGQGVHLCLGQHLARLELEIAFAGLLGRFPKLQLAVPVDEVAVYDGEHLDYGVHELPVSW